MVLKNFLHREIYLPLIHFYDLIQDFKRGIKTTENHEISELGFSDEIGNKYQPIGYKRLIEVIKFAVTLNRESCFIDAGCGKGRPLYIALEQGFNNVIGVEISKKLFNHCKKNLTKYNAIDVGLFKCSYGFFSFLENLNRNSSCSLSAGCNELIRQKLMGGVNIKDSFWLDIDTPDSLHFSRSNHQIFELINNQISN